MIVSCVSLFCPCVSSSLLHWLGTQATTGKADAPFSKKHLSCKSSHPRQKFKSPLVNNLFTQSCFPLNFGLFKESMYQVLLFCHILLIWKAIIGFAGVFRTAFLQTTSKKASGTSLLRVISVWKVQNEKRIWGIKLRTGLISEKEKNFWSAAASLPLPTCLSASNLLPRTSAHLQGTQNISCPRHLPTSIPIFHNTWSLNSGHGGEAKQIVLI